MNPMARRAWALLIATGLSACGGKVVVDGPATHGATSTTSTGNGGGPGAGGGSAGSTMNGGGSIPLAYNLAEYMPATIWPIMLRTSAIDSTGRLFVTDGKIVYAVTDGVPSIYLGYDDLKTNEPTMTTSVVSLDVGPDDRLYILERGYDHSILVSSGPHIVAVHMTLGEADALDPRCMAVESPNRILLMTTQGGLYEVTSAGAKQIYDETIVKSADQCAPVDFVVSQDGYFYFTPACAGFPLVAGKTDGSGAGIIKTVKDFEDFPAWNFGGLARHIGGGAVINFEGKTLYFDKTGKVTELSMTPPMTHFEDGMSGLLIFRSNRIEVAASGDIYFIDYHKIYRATPQ